MTENEINSESTDASGKKYDALEVDHITATNSCQMLESKQKLNNPVNITFHNISRKVRTLVKTGKGLRYKTDWKYILHNLSGQFLGGELTAVIGPSGAGKSSLLDIISGYTKDYEKGGYVNISCDHSQLSYNMYDNQLEPLLTVKESMICGANLKLGSTVSYNEKKSKIMGILSRLNLLNCKDKKTNQLSKGQYKLLSIALELISNPPAMFFDEPTSGLDCWSSKNIIDILKDLTRKGITIVCTIHQPSASLFAKFDRVYVMAKGCCAYQGSAYGLIPFLASIDNINLICPSHYNPADYMIDACIGEYDNVLDRNSSTYKTMNVFDNLVKKIDNGKNWISESVTFESSVDKSQKTAAQRIQINKIYEKNFESSEVYTTSYKYPTTIFAQLCILLHRTYLKLQRDTFFTQLRIILHVIVGSFIGGLFCSIGRDAANVFDNLSLLFFSLMFLMFTALSSTMMSFPSEMPIVTREYFNKWYSLKSYYLALTMVDTPIQILCVFCYCTIVYLVSQQPYEVFRFGLFVMMCSIVSLVAQAMGFLVGVLMEVKYGVIVGPIILLPWVIFSGYFLRLGDAPSSLKWLFHISFMKYGLEGVLMSIYGYDRSNLYCSDDYCHFVSPKKFLQEMEMNKVDFWNNFCLLFILFVVIRVITFFVLFYQLSHKKQIFRFFSQLWE